jgi:hypothetical protein
MCFPSATSGPVITPSVGGPNPKITPNTDGLSDAEKKDTTNISNGNVKGNVNQKKGDVIVVNPVLQDPKEKNFPKEFKIPDDFGKKVDPAKVVEEIRHAPEAKRNELLLNFENKIKKMDTPALKEMRDYLVTAMQDPKNKDDELLGALAKSVNKELDRRENSHNFEIHPIYIPEKHNDMDELKQLLKNNSNSGHAQENAHKDTGIGGAAQQTKQKAPSAQPPLDTLQKDLGKTQQSTEKK